MFQVRASGGLPPWCSRYLPLGAAWRTYRPGAKFDEMPVLIGPQGAGKSTALRRLLPPEHPEWFSDGLRLSADDKGTRGSAAREGYRRGGRDQRDARAVVGQADTVLRVSHVTPRHGLSLESCSLARA